LFDKESYLKQLFEKAEWTAEEKLWLSNFLEKTDSSELEKMMHESFSADLRNENTIDAAVSERMLGRINQVMADDKEQNKAAVIRMRTVKIAAACAIAVFLGWGSYLALKQGSKKPVVQTQAANTKKYKNDAEPGGEKAVLTLADGTTIVLDDMQNGALAQQGSTRVIKINGKLNYNAAVNGKDEVLYNMVATPIGGAYQVELPDGTLVWLNAASSLHFPTAFTGKERKVEITGEVYFEVAKNKSMPFIVSVNGAEIQVLGTHFNVMAYSNEAALATTLLEGAVKFVKDGNAAVLKPGQQSQLSTNGQIKVLSDINLAKVIAWKNNYFYFEGSDFQTIARQLARWYSIDIKCSRQIDDLFYAEIPRSTKLSDVLKALELTGKVRFEINDKTVNVLP
jgi:transmembrane sensor